MKNIIRITLIALITLFAVNSFSQGNLQFNRARMESYSIFSISDNAVKYDTIVVPAGKVLKITSTSCVFKTSSQTASNEYYIYDGVHTYIGNFRLTHGYNSIFPSTYPIWLSEGNHILRFVGATTNPSDAIFSFSGIEFNLVP
ncbi:hypothetical protein N9544_06440 [Flavobacteriales bacterium]|nr:hypothetical protein [Flavobacteriales bacterium]